MSAETKQAVDDAIAAHIADEGDGHFLSGYALIAAGQRIDSEGGRTLYYKEFSTDLPFHEAVGLTSYLALAVEHDMFQSDDDDE